MYMNQTQKDVLTFLFLMILFLLFILFGGGCFTRTVYVPDGQPIMLRQDVRSVKVWALDSKGKPVPGVMDLKEGWFCGSKKK